MVIVRNGDYNSITRRLRAGEEPGAGQEKEGRRAGEPGAEGEEAGDVVASEVHK